MAFYKKVYTPGDAVLAVVGDFKSDEMEAKLKGAVRRLERGGADGG